MHELHSLLLIGATGGLGKVVCTALASQRRIFRRLAIFHHTSRPTSPEKQRILDEYQEYGFEIIKSDVYDDINKYRGFDCLVIMLGNHALREQPLIIETAIQSGVRHFYPSEFGADLLVGSNWEQRYYKYKTITRNVLEEKGKQIPELGWTYFTIGRLTEWAASSHFGFDNKNSSALIYGTGKGRQSLLAVEDTAAYLIATLKDPIPEPGEDTGTTKGLRRTYRISAGSPSYEEIFEALHKITGRRYQVTYLPVNLAIEEEARAKQREDVDAELAASHKLIQGREGTLLPQPWDNGRFPLIKPKAAVEALKAAFLNPKYHKLLGLD